MPGSGSCMTRREVSMALIGAQIRCIEAQMACMGVQMTRMETPMACKEVSMPRKDGSMFPGHRSLTRSELFLRSNRSRMARRQENGAMRRGGSGGNAYGRSGAQCTAANSVMMRTVTRLRMRSWAPGLFTHVPWQTGYGLACLIRQHLLNFSATITTIRSSNTQLDLKMETITIDGLHCVQPIPRSTSSCQRGKNATFSQWDRYFL